MGTLLLIVVCSVKAMEVTILKSLSREDFDEMCEAFPEQRELIRQKSEEAQKQQEIQNRFTIKSQEPLLPGETRKVPLSHTTHTHYTHTHTRQVAITRVPTPLLLSIHLETIHHVYTTSSLKHPLCPPLSSYSALSRTPPCDRRLSVPVTATRPPIR